MDANSLVFVRSFFFVESRDFESCSGEESSYSCGFRRFDKITRFGRFGLKVRIVLILSSSSNF